MDIKGSGLTLASGGIFDPASSPLRSDGTPTIGPVSGSATLHSGGRPLRIPPNRHTQTANRSTSRLVRGSPTLQPNLSSSADEKMVA